MPDDLELSPPLQTRLREAVQRFSELQVLVVGDVMLDTYIWGRVERISPEAPVPIVEVGEETQLLGGTANVAHNVAAMGAKALVAGIVGNDGAGRELIRLLRRVPVPTDGLVVEDGRPTTRKTRIIAQNQQVVRFDHESRTPLQADSVKRVIAYIEKHLQRASGLIVSDYAKGMVTPGLMDALRSLVEGSDIPIIVDPKVRHIDRYEKVTMITPNHHEASRMAGVEIRDEATLIEAGRYLLGRLRCRTVLITRGKHGMSLFHQDGRMIHIPTVARRVYDVTGAGDTAIAAVTLGTAAGLSMVDAALLANIAAGIVVGEVGTAAVSRERLLDVIVNSRLSNES